MTDFAQLRDDLHDEGYSNFTTNTSQDSVSGLVYGINVSDAPKSVPEGEDTGPFKTLDDADALIPEAIVSLCDQYGVTPTVLGHGGDNIHVYID